MENDIHPLDSSSNSSSNSSSSNSSNNSSSNSTWEIVYPHQLSDTSIRSASPSPPQPESQPQRPFYSNGRNSNVYITLTQNYDSLHNSYIDPTTTIELILHIHLFKTLPGMSTGCIRSRDDDEDPALSRTNTKSTTTTTTTNMVQITIHIPRLYPHIPPTIYRIDYCNETDLHHAWHTRQTTPVDVVNEDDIHQQTMMMIMMIMIRNTGVPPSSKILQQYHYPTVIDQQMNSINSCINPSSLRHHHDRWIAGNYYKLNSTAPQESTHNHHHHHHENTMDSVNDYQNKYRFKYSQPLQEIILLSNPGDYEDCDTEHASSTSATCSNDILYIHKWTPIHRISDVIDWIVNGIIEPIPLGYDCDGTVTTLTTTSNHVNNVTTEMMTTSMDLPQQQPHPMNQSFTGITGSHNHNILMLDEEKDEYGSTYHGQYHFNNEPVTATHQQQQEHNSTKNYNTQNDGPMKSSSSSSVLTKQRRNSLPSSTIDEYYSYDNSNDMTMEQVNLPTENNTDSITASIFLHPNRFHVGYHCDDNHDTVDNTNVHCPMDSDTPASSAVCQSRPQLQPSRPVAATVNGYWNNRSETKDRHHNDNSICKLSQNVKHTDCDGEVDDDDDMDLSCS